MATASPDASQRAAWLRLWRILLEPTQKDAPVAEAGAEMLEVRRARVDLQD